MQFLAHWAERLAAPALRFSLAVVLFWIGALKFAHPEPVVELLQASFWFLAHPGVVYGLGVLEVGAALLLVLGIGLPLVGILCMGLFTGTLAIFLVAPGVSFGQAGFPNLSLAGEFLLKDLVLFAASLAVVGLASPKAEPAR